MNTAKKSKVLVAARDVFLRYGYKRVSMNDIAEAAGISRPALYILFKNKEQIFSGVFLRWVEETVAVIEKGMAALTAPEEKIEYAFEIWTVAPFAMVVKSPEARELIECSFTFAQDSLNQGYKKFESVILPVVTKLAETHPARKHMSPETIVHVLASAARGFKQTATTPAELRLLIKDLLTLSLLQYF